VCPGTLWGTKIQSDLCRVPESANWGAQHNEHRNPREEKDQGDRLIETIGPTDPEAASTIKPTGKTHDERQTTPSGRQKLIQQMAQPLAFAALPTPIIRPEKCTVSI
jgi:hypothetical protein